MVVGTIIAVMFQFIFPDAIKVPAIIPALAAALVAYLLGHWLERIKSGV